MQAAGTRRQLKYKVCKLVCKLINESVWRLWSVHALRFEHEPDICVFNAHHFSLSSSSRDILNTKLLHWLVGWHPGSTEGVVRDLRSHQVSGCPWAAGWFIESNGKIWAVVSNGFQTSLQLDCKSSSGLLASCKRLNGLYIMVIYQVSWFCKSL